MPRLLSYGTLQREEVQLATFGRRLDGRADELVGYEPSLVRIEDAARATPTSGGETWVYVHAPLQPIHGQ